MKYYPFGETRPGYPTGSVGTDHRFTGQREETGLGSLYDYGARFYSPVLGRFLSADTIVLNPVNPQAFNRYSYTSNNPLKYIDPSGHAFTEIVNAGGAGGNLGAGSGCCGGSGEAAAYVMAVLFSPLPVIAEPIDMVTSGVQCLGGDGWACVGAVAPFVNGAAAKGLGKVLGLVDNVPTGVADEVVESVADVGKSDIAAELSKGLPQQQRIAKAINDGDIGVNILDKESFARQARSTGWWSDPEDLKGIAYKDQIYLREGSASIYSDAVHEGTHAIDYLDNFKGPSQSWERRAYYCERQYQIYSNRGLDFETLPDMLRHIRTVY